MATSKSTRTTTQDPENQVPEDTGESRMTADERNMYKELMAERREKAQQARDEAARAGEVADDDDPQPLSAPPQGDEPPEDTGEGDEPDPEEHEQGEPDPGQGGEPPAEDPEPPPGDEPAGDEPPADEPSGDEPEQDFDTMLAQQPEPIRDMVGRLQQQNEQLWQQYNAVYGRLAPMQRQNSDLQKQLDDLKKASTESPTLEDLENNSAFKSIADEFPDESGKVKEVFTSQARANQELQQRAQQLEQELERSNRERVNIEYRRLLRKHPDFENIRRMPQFQQWRQQVLGNPEAHGDLPQKMNSPLYEDAADVATAFKKQVLGQNQNPPPPPTPRPQGQQRQPQNPQAQISRRAPPPPAPPSQPSGITGNRQPERPLTGKALYKKIMADKRKEAAKKRR